MLFQSLAGHSALHLLHHCTKLSELDMDEVFNVLRREVPLDTEGSLFPPIECIMFCGEFISKSPWTQFEEKLCTMFSVHDQSSVKKDKSVRFADYCEGNGKQSPSPLSLEQRHDIVMYRAYCTLKLVMDVLAFCADSTNWEMLGTLKVQRSSLISIDGSVTDCDRKDPTKTNMEVFKTVPVF